MWAVVILAYHIASRLAYVLYAGFALKQQDQVGHFTRRYGAEEGFRRFRRVVSSLMYNDGVSFVLLCLVTRNTLELAWPRAWTIMAGAVLVVLGSSVKLWATATLGAKAYYWHSFFVPADGVASVTSGPYRFLKNPMYTVGYLQAYGLALVTGSVPGLAAALFDQAAILAFHRWVEKPHFERLSARDAGMERKQQHAVPK